jgi:hypothetical protein
MRLSLVSRGMKCLKGVTITHSVATLSRLRDSSIEFQSTRQGTTTNQRYAENGSGERQWVAPLSNRVGGDRTRPRFLTHAAHRGAEPCSTFATPLSRHLYTHSPPTLIERVVNAFIPNARLTHTMCYTTFLTASRIQPQPCTLTPALTDTPPLRTCPHAHACTFMFMFMCVLCTAACVCAPHAVHRLCGADAR